MTWHSFLNLSTLENRHLLAAYITVWVIQGGYFAWVAWLFVHIFFLIGFRNRIIVLIQWAWSYLTYERGARLITGSMDLPGWTDSKDSEASLQQVR